ncbi:DUF72 domain-containing protein [Geoglobus acetivorans]|uniref:DUF72 domain-containing protein n=1 Tax=Geoglobus acetivorans TaxID=565033 RepID=A0ABZ3H3B4_GEOAI|nr:DUF72 domain-containing protein [Geoglobus acetivorans]
MIKVGCCGLPVSMADYFRMFDVVEVQKTFYKPPMPETAERWRELAGEGFEFTVKAFQVITHPPSSPTYRKAKLKVDDGGFFKPVKAVFDAWERTREVAKILNSSVIVFQTPRSFRECEENVRNMKEFFNSIEREFVFCWEPRGWGSDVVKDVCQKLDLVHVVDPFVSRSMHGEIRYYRLHGFNYRHKYSDDELKWLLERVSGERTCYVMFNNMHMLEDAIRFREMSIKRK